MVALVATSLVAETTGGGTEPRNFGKLRMRSSILALISIYSVVALVRLVRVIAALAELGA
jgi:hypothetical protein